MINLRAVFRGIMTSWGEDVVLYRMCKCTEVGQFARTSCPDCTGSGFISPAERHKARRTLQSIPIDETASLQDEGDIQHDNQWFFMPYNVDPSPGDMIVVIDPSAPTGKVAYMVGNTMPIRGAKGRIEYWRIGASRMYPK